MPSNQKHYTSVSVPGWARDLLGEVQSRLLTGGALSLPEELRIFAEEKNRPDEGAPVRKDAWTLGTVLGIACKLAIQQMDAIEKRDEEPANVLKPKKAKK